MLAQSFVTVLAAPPHMRGPMLPILPDSCFPGYRTGASGAPEYSSLISKYIYEYSYEEIVWTEKDMNYIRKCVSEKSLTNSDITREEQDEKLHEMISNNVKRLIESCRLTSKKDVKSWSVRYVETYAV